jgi:hypothetical protein
VSLRRSGGHTERPRQDRNAPASWSLVGRKTHRPGRPLPIRVGGHGVSSPLESECLVEGDGAGDQLTGQPVSSVGVADLNIADEAVEAVEHARRFVEVGRDESGERTVDVGEFVRLPRGIDGGPRQIPLRLVAVEPVCDLLGDEVDEFLALPVIRDPELLDVPTDWGLVGREGNDIHVWP